jgi:glycosyltransferase involved in cell wall biosynthesis
MNNNEGEIKILIIGPTKPLGGMENCVILHASLNLGDGFRLYHLDTKYNPIVRKSKLLKVIYLYGFLIPRMRNIIRKEKIDIVHIHTTSFDRFYSGLSSFLRRRLEWGLNHSDALICLSEGWRQFFAKIFRETKVYVLENAIDLEPFRELGEHRNYDDRAEFTALYLGRISEMKGTFDLVDVARKLKDEGTHVHFIVAGRSERGETSKLRWTLRDAGLSDWFEFPGEVTGFHRDELFRKADCFILPSHAEGMPITVIEAFAVGLPVIATDVGAVPEIIHNEENGLIVKARDIDGFVRSLTRLKMGRELREKLGRAGYGDAQRRFSAARWITELRRIYSEVTGA